MYKIQNEAAVVIHYTFKMYILCICNEKDMENQKPEMQMEQIVL
jgi:hypothetical protein